MIKANHSRYWLSKYVQDTLSDTKYNAFRLANIKQAIKNYTKIISKKDIKVVYSDLKKSFATADNTITISNECDNNIDLTVGLALHEIAHIEESDFKYLDELKIHFPISIENRLNTEVESEYFVWLDHFKFIINLIEDYRVNQFIIDHYCGYEPYIQEIQNEYVHNDMISGILQSDMYRDESWESYEFRFLYHENIKSDLTVLKELPYLVHLLDASRIARLQNILDVGELAKQILIIIFNAVYKQKVQTTNLPENKSTDTDLPSNIPDTNYSTNKTVSEYIKHINGNDKKKILKTKEQIQLIDMINETDTQYVNVSVNDIIHPVLVIKNFNKTLIDSDIGLFTEVAVYVEENIKVIQQGINLGRNLANRLECLNDIKNTRYTYLKKGKIDGRLINTLGYGSESIFYRDEQDEVKTIDLHLSIDMSGSMLGIKIQNSLICAIALAYAASVINSLNVVIDFRFVANFDNKHSPCVLLAYNSKTDNIQKIKELFKYLHPMSATPEGLCFAAILDIIKETNCNEKYFINFSDGYPAYGKYTGNVAYKHTKNQIDLIKKVGIKVISYFISKDIQSDNESKFFNDKFKLMYGLDSHYINVTDILQITRTLNNKFLE